MFLESHSQASKYSEGFEGSEAATSLKEFSGEKFDAHVDDLKAHQGYVLFPNLMGVRSEQLKAKIRSKVPAFKVVYD